MFAKILKSQYITTMYRYIIITGLFILSALFTSAQVNRENYSLLWKIEHPDRQTGYLFGTVHLSDEEVFDIPDSVFACIEKTDVFALEIDFEASVSSLLNSKKYKQISSIENPKNKDLKYYETYKKLKEKKNKTKVEQRETFLDAYLYKAAKKLGKKPLA